MSRDIEKFKELISAAKLPRLERISEKTVKQILLTILDGMRDGQNERFSIGAIIGRCGVSGRHVLRIFLGLEQLGLLMMQEDKSWSIVWTEIARLPKLTSTDK